MGRGHGIIRGRKCPSIQLCPTCGEMRAWHTGGLYVCPVPAEVTSSLQRFKDSNGRRWKSILRAHWENACQDVSDINERSLLQQARNLIGPRRLDKITLK